MLDVSKFAVNLPAFSWLVLLDWKDLGAAFGEGACSACASVD